MATGTGRSPGGGTPINFEEGTCSMRKPRAWNQMNGWAAKCGKPPRPSAAAAAPAGAIDRPTVLEPSPRRPHEPFLRKRVFRKGSWGLPCHPTKEEPRGAPARLGRPPHGGRPPARTRPEETPRPTQGGLVLHRPAMAAGVAPTTGGSSAVRTPAHQHVQAPGPFGPRWSPPPLAATSGPKVGSDRRDSRQGPWDAGLAPGRVGSLVPGRHIPPTRSRHLRTPAL